MTYSGTLTDGLHNVDMSGIYLLYVKSPLAAPRKYATVLRNAGLVDTVRSGTGANYTLTGLGFHLLVTNVGWADAFEGA
jgi:hypothetical protein